MIIQAIILIIITILACYNYNYDVLDPYVIVYVLMMMLSYDDYCICKIFITMMMLSRDDYACIALDPNCKIAFDNYAFYLLDPNDDGTVR